MLLNPWGHAWHTLSGRSAGCGRVRRTSRRPWAASSWKTLWQAGSEVSVLAKDPSLQGKVPGGAVPALHCGFHLASRSKRRLQHRVSLAQSAWLVLRSLLVCEAKLFKIHIGFLRLLICLNLVPNELESHND